MLYPIIFIGLLFALSLVALYFERKVSSNAEVPLILFGGFGLFVVFTASIILSISGYAYYAAGVKADIMNREYGTEYTQAEVFYASQVIDTIRELNRTRVEINGNIFETKE